jgi:hypothetical protein
MPEFPFKNRNTGWMISTLGVVLVIGLLFALNPQHASFSQWLGVFNLTTPPAPQ